MIKTASVAAGLLRSAETRAKIRATHGLQRLAVGVAVGTFVFGAMVFGSVGILLLLGASIGYGVAAILVALLWLVAAIVAGIGFALLENRAEPPLLPPGAAEKTMVAVAEDLGSSSPWIAIAGLAVGFLASRRG